MECHREESYNGVQKFISFGSPESSFPKNPTRVILILKRLRKVSVLAQFSKLSYIWSALTGSMQNRLSRFTPYFVPNQGLGTKIKSFVILNFRLCLLIGMFVFNIRRKHKSYTPKLSLLRWLPVKETSQRRKNFYLSEAFFVIRKVIDNPLSYGHLPCKWRQKNAFLSKEGGSDLSETEGFSLVNITFHQVLSSFF